MPEELTTMVVDGGARGHALAEAHQRSPHVKKTVVAPGNDFMAYNAEKEVVTEYVDLTNPETILDAALRHHVDVVELANDYSVACGGADLLREAQIRTYGPTKAASRIEWSKVWAREFMTDIEVPQPPYKIFFDAKQAFRYFEEAFDTDPQADFYLKADGLGAGKATWRIRSLRDAACGLAALQEYRTANQPFLVDKTLPPGEEYSYYVVTDGTRYSKLKTAQDYKRSHERDTGEQTGGMGATAPTSLIDNERSALINKVQIEPVLKKLQYEGHPYQGWLYLGGMWTKEGPSTVEFNARPGDPETQAIAPGITSDYVEHMQSVIDAELREPLVQDKLVRICVVGAVKGYPKEYPTGLEIKGINRVQQIEGVRFYSASISVQDGRFYSQGGRVFSVVGEGENIAQASALAYDAMQYLSIGDDQLHYRPDIGWRDLKRHKRAA